jgi:hypothetical protein
VEKCSECKRSCSWPVVLELPQIIRVPLSYQRCAVIDCGTGIPCCNCRPSFAPDRFEQSWHSGCVFDNALICASVQPHSRP